MVKQNKTVDFISYNLNNNTRSLGGREEWGGGGVVKTKDTVSSAIVHLVFICARLSRFTISLIPGRIEMNSRLDSTMCFVVQ